MKCSRIPVSMLSLLLLGACGSSSEPFAATKKNDSSLENPDNIRAWANTVSAIAIYANAYEPIAVADGEKSYDDPACPVVTDDGTTLTIEGDCTTTGGTSWVGKATVKRHANGDRELTLEDFGTRSSEKDSDTRDGEAALRRIDDTTQDFSVDLVHESGVSVTIDYEGRVEGDYDLRTVWNGSGTVVREGLLAPAGTTEVTTSAAVVDDEVCGQPASGNTTIHNDADETVVVTYDGDVDCDDEQAATYTLNGVSKGKITGIACAASPGSTGSGSTAMALSLFAVALVARRRRPRPLTPVDPVDAHR